MAVKTLTANDVAKLLGVPVKEIYRLIREGLLKGYKTKDTVRLDAESVDLYVLRKENPTQQ